MKVKRPKIIAPFFWDDPYNRLSNPVLIWIISLAFLGMSLANFVNKDLANASKVILLALSLPLFVRGNSKLPTNKAVWFLLVATLIPAISWWLSTINHPNWAEAYPKLDQLSFFFFFLPFAWCLAGSTRNTMLVWATAAAGFLVAPWLTGDALSTWERGLAGNRVDFDIRNAQHSAMLFGTLLLGMLVFMRRICTTSRGMVWWRSGLWLIVTLTCVAGVVVTQTRGVWIALIVSLLFMGGIIGILRILKRNPTLPSNLTKYAGALVAVLAIGSAIIMYPLADSIRERLTTEKESIGQIISVDISDLAYDSAGIRMHTWIAALEGIAQRPFFGWGANGAEVVLRKTEWLPDHVKEQFGHMHNSYLETMVRYGLAGTALFVVLLIWTTKGIIRAWCNGTMPGDMAIFGLVYGSFWLIINFFESYIYFSPGAFVFNLVMAGLVTHIWREAIPNFRTERKRLN